MRFSVVFQVPVESVPAEVAQALRETLIDIGEVMQTVPRASAFWLSMSGSPLQIEILGWRFRYRVEPDQQELRVVEAHPPAS